MNSTSGAEEENTGELLAHLFTFLAINCSPTKRQKLLRVLCATASSNVGLSLGCFLL